MKDWFVFILLMIGLLLLLAGLLTGCRPQGKEAICVDTAYRIENGSQHRVIRDKITFPDRRTARDFVKGMDTDGLVGLHVYPCYVTGVVWWEQLPKNQLLAAR